MKQISNNSQVGANSLDPPYFPYLKMAAQTFLICAPHRLQPAPPARYGRLVGLHMHRLTASCCLWHTIFTDIIFTFMLNKIHQTDIVSAPFAIKQSLQASRHLHLVSQTHTLTCTVPLLSRLWGMHLLRWHIPPSPQSARANTDTLIHQHQSQGRNTVHAGQQKQSLPWPVPTESELQHIPGLVASPEWDGTVLQYHSSVPQGLPNFCWCLKIT